MIDFGLWTLKEARDYCKAYADAIPIRREWLADELRARGEDPAMLADEERLPELWTWATQLIDTGPTTMKLQTRQPAGDPQPGVRPPWHEQDEPSPVLSDGVLWLIELLGAHLATLILAAAPEAHWDVYRASRKLHDVNQHRTKLFGTRPLGVGPASMIHTVVVGRVYHGKPWSQQQTLQSLYEYSLAPAV